MGFDILRGAYDLPGSELDARHITSRWAVKYHKVPKNRILARVNFNYDTFRDRDGVAYLGNKSTMR